MIEEKKDVSDQLVGSVQIFFGIVLALGFVINKEILLSPFSKEYFLSFFALLTIVITALLNWIDWHITMNLRPYNFDRMIGKRIFHELRFVSDIFIIIVYLYILIAITYFINNSYESVSKFIWGYVILFFSYFISGLLRICAYGPLASKISLILLFCLSFTALAICYEKYIKYYFDQYAANLFSIGLVFILVIVYRLTRRAFGLKLIKNKSKGLKIGIDLDGVLANHITGILSRIKIKHGIDIKYEDITYWQYRVGSTSIDREIGIAMEDENYVISMPSQPFARNAVISIYPCNSIHVVTARPSHTNKWSRYWLEKNGIVVDGFLSIGKSSKSVYAFDILIDDYINNIIEYLDNSVGFAILVDQPWNKDRGELCRFLSAGRLRIISSLQQIPTLIEELTKSVHKFPIN